MTTATAPAPTARPAPAPTAKPVSKPVQKGLSPLSLALNEWAFLLSHPVKRTSSMSVGTFRWSRNAQTTRADALEDVVRASKPEASRRCADGVDRSGDALADYWAGVKVDSAARREELKSAARAHAPK